MQKQSHSRNGSWTGLLTGLLLLALASAASAAIFTITGDPADAYIKSDGVVQSPTALFNRTGSENSPTNSAAIFVFQLPDLGGEAVTTADLTVVLQNNYLWGESFNADLYAVRTAGSSAIVSNDFHIGSYVGTDPNGATGIQDNFLTPLASSGSTNHTDSAGDGALSAWLQAEYDGGAQAGDFAFLRLSADAIVEVGYRKYETATADATNGTAPVLTIETGSSTPTASTIPYAEDFEPPLTNGQAIVEAGGWSASAGDLSTVRTSNYTFTASSRPLETNDHTQVLQLDTAGGTLTNTFDMPAADRVLYIDSMVMMNARTSAPVEVFSDLSVQFLVYVDTNRNPVVFNGGQDGTNRVFTTVTGTTVQPGWNRLTVTLDYQNGDDTGLPPVERRYAKVQIDGQDMISSQAYSAPGVTGPFDGGAWFFTADAAAGQDAVSSLDFRGEGYLDDVVVSTNKPSFAGAGQYVIRSLVSGPGAVIPSSEILVNSGADTQVVFHANVWHEIASLQTDGTAVPPAAGETSYTASFVNVAADISNDVLFVVTLAAVDGKTPATWYGPLGADPALADEDADGLALFEEFLINTDPVATSNRFEVIAGGVDGAFRPTLRWRALGPANGTPVVDAATGPSSGSWSNLSGSSVFGDGTNTWTADDPAGGASSTLRLQVQE